MTDPALQLYRRDARATAILRDGGLCMYCFWMHERKRKGEHVHHVFGRARDQFSVKESVTSLMTVCAECHPSPILNVPTKEWQTDVLTVWHNMNVVPRGRIQFPPDMVVENPIGLRPFKVTDAPIVYWSL